MKNKIKLKGILKSYISISVYLGVLLCAVDLAVWCLDVKSALVMTAFTVFYFLILFFFSRNLLASGEGERVIAPEPW